MKLSSRSEQIKINLKDETLKKKLTYLEFQLAELKAQQKILYFSVVKFEDEGIYAQEPRTSSNEMLLKVNSLSGKLRVDMSKFEVDPFIKIEAGKSNADPLRKVNSEINQQNELLFSQLMQMQEVLEKFIFGKKLTKAYLVYSQIETTSQIEIKQIVASQLESEVSSLSAERAMANNKLVTFQKKLDIASKAVSCELNTKHAENFALKRLKSKSSIEYGAVLEKYHQQVQTTMGIKSGLAKHLVRLPQTFQDRISNQDETSEMRQPKLELEGTLVHTLLMHEQFKIDSVHQVAQQGHKPKEADQEHELFEAQYMQVQPELKCFNLEKAKLESIHKLILLYATNLQDAVNAINKNLFAKERCAVKQLSMTAGVSTQAG